jgi:hypothetical protein
MLGRFIQWLQKGLKEFNSYRQDWKNRKNKKVYQPTEIKTVPKIMNFDRGILPHQIWKRHREKLARMTRHSQQLAGIYRKG